jgi:shikimate dehydrogenase
MSPFIHKRLFELSGIDADYGVLDIEDLAADYDSVLKKLDGYNVTIPHKQAIIPLIDKLDPKAEMYGSVNTVRNRDGEATGFTTDPDGFLKALEYADIPLSGRVVILGCGGVARTMAYEAALKGARVELAVRAQSIEKADSLAREIRQAVPAADIGVLDVKSLEGDVVTLINGTPVGMSPKTDAQPVSDAQLKRCANVFDAIYNPLNTLMIQKAKANGSNAEGGMSMLVWQAVAAQYHWNGSSFDRRDIERLCSDASKELENR